MQSTQTYHTVATQTFSYACFIRSYLNACGISLALYLVLSSDWSMNPSISLAITVDTRGRITPAAYKLYHKSVYMLPPHKLRDCSVNVMGAHKLRNCSVTFMGWWGGGGGEFWGGAKRGVFFWPNPPKKLNLYSIYMHTETYVKYPNKHIEYFK